VAAVATLLLVIVGGLVTSKQAGLAVVDWPNSFGYNMFLYPLSRMSGGVYYEHAHRLFGSLVGLTTVVLAWHLHRVDARRWLRLLALALVVVVVVQGILGGLRVTGTFTLSTAPEDMAPSTPMAVIHGVLGQLFFAAMVAMAVFLSRSWRRAAPPRPAPGAGTDRVLAIALLASLAVQLVLGALQRHTEQGLLTHITVAALVVGLGLTAGVRTWGLYGDQPVLRRLGNGLLGLLGLQVLLGIGALVAVTARAAGTAGRPWQALLATAHQTTGALLLATAVMLVMWLFRVLTPAPVEA
jgi:cytochrome c oxidase assembly protein subunit 15